MVLRLNRQKERVEREAGEERERLRKKRRDGGKGRKGGEHADVASDNEMNEAYLGSVRVRIVQVL